MSVCKLNHNGTILSSYISNIFSNNQLIIGLTVRRPISSKTSTCGCWS